MLSLNGEQSLLQVQQYSEKMMLDGKICKRVPNSTNTQTGWLSSMLYTLYRLSPELLGASAQVLEL
jgi:hypothetical protein